MARHLKLEIILIVSIISSVLSTPMIEKGSWRKSSITGKKFIITMKEGVQRALTSTPDMSMSRGDRLAALVHSLQQLSSESQKNVVQVLEIEQVTRKDLTWESLWISNQIILQGADAAILQKLEELDQVSQIFEEPLYQLQSVNSNPASSPRVCGVKPEFSWGLKKIKVPEVWELGYIGQGVIVANIDSGVHEDHEALRSNYVGAENNGWFDPESYTQTPNDDDSHGTHVMGTITGQNGIGAAPGARWMACKGCGYSCSSFRLLQCFQFMMCPTFPDGSFPNCAKAPHMINNSWGGPGEDPTFDEALKALQKAGIVVVFAIGNSGPGCETTLSPGNSPYVIGVGATTIDDDIAEFSSSGPGPIEEARLKPELVAPGDEIMSSVPGISSDCYGESSGTSMASPQITGVIALMLSKNPDLTIPEIRQILFESLEHIQIKESRDCGDLTDDDCPNYTIGHGRINALKAVTNTWD